MDFWYLMIRKDDYIFFLIDRLLIVLNYIKQIGSRRIKNLPIEKVNEDIYIVLNGPSIKEQDLSVLTGKDVMFVNRGFMHPLYAQIKPKYHVFVDPKMLSGEWKLEWLDEIHSVNPDVVFIMPVEWATKTPFQPFIQKGYKFYWMPFRGKCSCIGVSGTAFNFALLAHYERVYFTGFEATGLPHELLRTASHFYGVNEENLKKTCYNYEQDLYMMSRQIHELNRFAAKCKKLGIKIYNFTRGGILDMFDRVDICK